MMTLPISLTIAIPAYNRQYQLSNVLERMQPLFDNNRIEFLVVDDGSTPEIKLEKGLEKGNLNLVRNDTNIGFYENFLKILDIAQGQYILFLNDDDFLVNENIQILLTILKTSSASFISTQFFRNHKLYRGKQISKNINIGEFFESSAHSPGLIFRSFEIKQNAKLLRSLKIDKSLQVYPQVLVVIVAFLKGQEMRWLNLEIAREGYDSPTGQSPNDRGYWTPEERWSQFVAFFDVINQITQRLEVSKSKEQSIKNSLNKLAAKQLASAMLRDINKTTLMFWLIFTTRVIKNTFMKIRHALFH